VTSSDQINEQVWSNGELKVSPGSVGICKNECGANHDSLTATTPLKVPTNTRPADSVGVAKRDV